MAASARAGGIDADKSAAHAAALAGVNDVRAMSERCGPTKWAVIAKNLNRAMVDAGMIDPSCEQERFRLGKQCRERWFNHLDPTLKKGKWTAEEDRVILELQKKLGNKWCEISKSLPGRSENATKNRWNSRARKRRLSSTVGAAPSKAAVAAALRRGNAAKAAAGVTSTTTESSGSGASPTPKAAKKARKKTTKKRKAKSRVPRSVETRPERSASMVDHARELINFSTSPRRSSPAHVHSQQMSDMATLLLGVSASPVARVRTKRQNGGFAPKPSPSNAVLEALARLKKVNSPVGFHEQSSSRAPGCSPGSPAMLIESEVSPRPLASTAGDAGGGEGNDEEVVDVCF